MEEKPLKCHLCHNTFTASQLLQQVLEKYLGFSSTQVFIMESGRQAIQMSLNLSSWLILLSPDGRRALQNIKDSKN